MGKFLEYHTIIREYKNFKDKLLDKFRIDKKLDYKVFGKVLEAGKEDSEYKDIFLVEFNVDIYGHDGSRLDFKKRGKDGHCWNFYFQEFNRMGIEKLEVEYEKYKI
jgi:hypothetical protein